MELSEKEYSELTEKRFYQRKLTKKGNYSLNIAEKNAGVKNTEAKLKNDKVKGENNANKTHYIVGRKIRNTIKELGGTRLEDLPTPNKSLKELEKEKLEIEK